MKKLPIVLLPLLIALFAVIMFTSIELSHEGLQRLMLITMGMAFGGLTILVIKAWNVTSESWSAISLGLTSEILGLFFLVNALLTFEVAKMPAFEFASWELLGCGLCCGIYCTIGFARKEWKNSRSLSLIAGFTGTCVTVATGFISISLLNTQFPNWIGFVS